MKKVAELEKNERVDIYARVKEVKEQQTKSETPKPYIFMVLADLTGTIEAKYWEKTLASTPDAEVGKIIKVRAKVAEYRNKKYLTVEQMRTVNEKDDINLEEIVGSTQPSETPASTETGNVPESTVENQVEATANPSSQEAPAENQTEETSETASSEVQTTQSATTEQTAEIPAVKKLADLVKGDKAEMFALTRMIVEGATKTTPPSPYITLKLEDSSGSLTGKMWDTSIKDLEKLGIKANMLVKIEGTMGEWTNKEGKVESQIVVTVMRLATTEDNVNMDDYIKSAPIKAEIMFESITEHVNGFSNEELKAVCITVLNGYKEQLLRYPGALRIHHAIKSGLLYHMYSMLGAGDALGDLYPVNKELLSAGIIVHDIGKLEELDVNEFGLCSEYTDEGKLLGHMISGVKMLHDICTELKISQRVEKVLEHFIVSHHYEETWGAYKKPKTLEAELLHHLDLMDSKMNTFIEALTQVEENDFSEAVYSLDKRSIYKFTL